MKRFADPKKDPRVSLLAYLNAAQQRAAVERMRVVLPQSAVVFAYERDGFVYVGPKICAEVFADAAGVAVKVGAYPDERAAWHSANYSTGAPME
eukprot:12585698-Alexandrium_andersonii.AAC.1